MSSGSRPSSAFRLLPFTSPSQPRTTGHPASVRTLPVTGSSLLRSAQARAGGCSECSKVLSYPERKVGLPLLPLIHTPPTGPGRPLPPPPHRSPAPLPAPSPSPARSQDSQRELPDTLVDASIKATGRPEPLPSKGLVRRRGRDAALPVLRCLPSSEALRWKSQENRRIS